MTATVVVRGTGRARARPDRAVLAFDLSHTAPTPRDALEQVARRTAQLEDVLHQRGVGDADWTTTGVMVQAAYEWRKDQQAFLGHRAANRIHVTTQDPMVVGRLLTDAVEVAGARVGGPEWVVEPANPAHAEACLNAAADARRRAEAYARGLGLELGPVVTVDEAADSPLRPRPVQPRFALAAAAAADECAPIEVNAGDLEVTAEVVVTFTLVVPGA